MAKRITTVEVDGVKLREIFKKRGLKMLEVSRDCGYEESYFSHVCRDNKITKSAMIILQDRYKIYPNEYELDKVESEIVESEIVHAELLPVEVTQSTEFTISDDTAKKLHTIIYSAVYEAVKLALNE